MAYTTINKSSLHFNTKLYSGNNGTNAITGVGFQPDWVWGKSRNSAYAWQVYDSNRGTGKYLEFDDGTETTNANSLKSFDAKSGT